MNNSQIINNIIDDPVKTLNGLSKKQIISVLEECDTAFFNSGDTLVSDDMYDIIKNHLKKIDPKNAYFKRVGADEIHKVDLPFWLGSQDKIKDDEREINKWITKYSTPKSYIISEKLDGISCLIYYINNEIKIYTRGNGTEGQDISHIISYINIPPILPKTSKITNKLAVRGELIISRENWEKIKHVGSNARNVVAGALHSKIINKEIMEKIEFVAYDMLFPRKTLKDAFIFLTELKFKVVKYIETDTITLDILSNLLQDWRKKSLYEIDGIVIIHNDIHNLISGKNPKYSFAFKSILTHDQAEVIVNDIEWNISKDRYIKPIIKFNEVVIAGVKIKQATGFNANYIQTNIIGPGSRIIIIRSGDVIPHVLKVLTPSANNKPKMPDVPFIWNDTRVDIMLNDTKKNREHDIKTFMYFMKTLEVPYVGEGIITKLYDSGYDTLFKLINITVPDLIKIEGFKETNSKKIFDSLSNVKKVSCEDLLNASNILGRGFGTKRIKLIFQKFPFLINDRNKALGLTVDNLKEIDGVSNVIALQFIENLPKFYKFYDELGIKCTNTVLSPVVNANIAKSFNKNLKDKKFVFTGFRNKDYEKIIEDNGGHISTTISKTTSYLVVKSKDDNSNKVKQANDLNIPIISKEEFEKLL